MAWAPVALAAGSSLLGAYGSYQEGKQQQYAHDYNAEIAEQDAQQAALAGRISDRQLEKQGASLRSTQSAMYAKAGVTASGSALDVMLKSAANVEFDRAIERYNTAVSVTRAQSEADMQRYYGRVAKWSGKVGAVKTLLSGAVKAAGNMPIPTGGP